MAINTIDSRETTIQQKSSDSEKNEENKIDDVRLNLLLFYHHQERSELAEEVESVVLGLKVVVVK